MVAIVALMSILCFMSVHFKLRIEAILIVACNELKQLFATSIDWVFKLIVRQNENSPPRQWEQKNTRQITMQIKSSLLFPKRKKKCWNYRKLCVDKYVRCAIWITKYFRRFMFNVHVHCSAKIVSIFVHVSVDASQRPVKPNWMLTPTFWHIFISHPTFPTK